MEKRMIIYIVRRDEKILACYASLAKAKARVDKELADLQGMRGSIHTVKELARGSQAKLYCLLGYSGSPENGDWESVRCWVQQHHLDCSALELLGHIAE
jgi:hypothetical protein